MPFARGLFIIIHRGDIMYRLLLTLEMMAAFWLLCAIS